jgi:hypothetical protein
MGRAMRQIKYHTVSAEPVNLAGTHRVFHASKKQEH